MRTHAFTQQLITLAAAASIGACDAGSDPLDAPVAATSSALLPAARPSNLATPKIESALAEGIDARIGLPTLAAPTPPAMLIVSEDDLVEVAERWADYRRGLGFEVEVRVASALGGAVPTAATLSQGLRAELAAMAEERGTTAGLFLLLLGDAPPGGATDAGHIPAAMCSNHTPLAAGCWTDHLYSDLDGDGLPDVATGRVPASTIDEAHAALAKLQAFESHYQIGPHNRRVSLYVGDSGFGPAIDGLLESIMFQGLDRMSYDFDIVGAWDNPDSTYWFLPFSDKVVDLYNEGPLMTVYIGHGSEDGTEGLTTAETERIDCRPRRPLSLFFACNTGNYVGDDDSLSETLFFMPDGPIATYGASEVSHPFVNAVLAYESQRVALSMRWSTVGEVLLATERALFDNAADDFRITVSGAAMIEDSTASEQQQEQLLAEHIALYNLLGDPATSMQYPRGKVTHIEATLPNDPILAVTVSGRVEGIRSGTALVTIETPRDVIVGELRDIDPWNASRADVAANWLASNQKAVARLEVPIVNGRFVASITPSAPLSTRIDYRVKVYAFDDVRDAIGSAHLR